MKPEQLLEISSQTATVAFHKFVLLLKNREKDLYCFFEGKDSQYYSLRIKQFTSKPYHPITCGNKKTVIQTYELLQNSKIYNSISKAFFIDRDFDEQISKTNIYETPCYSVENFYVNAHTMSEILKNEFLMTEVDDEYKNVMQLFENELNVFCHETLFFNAWYATLRKKKNKEGLPSTNANLDEKLPNGFLCIEIGSIKSNYNLEKIIQTFPTAISVTTDEINSTLEDLKKSQLSRTLRGKFQIWFLYSFLQFLINDSIGKKEIIKNRTKFRIDKPNILSQLSQYAVTTDCLIHYLKQINN